MLTEAAALSNRDARPKQLYVSGEVFGWVVRDSGDGATANEVPGSARFQAWPWSRLGGPERRRRGQRKRGLGVTLVAPFSEDPVYEALTCGCCVYDFRSEGAAVANFVARGLARRCGPCSVASVPRRQASCTVSCVFVLLVPQVPPPKYRCITGGAHVFLLLDGDLRSEFFAATTRRLSITDRRTSIVSTEY